MKILVLLTAPILTAVVSAARASLPDPLPGVTSVPPTYLIHYLPDAPRDPRFVEGLRAAPPDILHLGHAVPLNSIFGPTADYSGWKPKLVDAAEILRRKDELRGFVSNLHQAGISKVICYINPSILGGDHEKRLGFWAFYDRWEDYEALGVGSKPERSPDRWMQRNRRSFAPWEPEPNYPLWRYQPCPNEPAWTKYQSAVVRLIAECGYDGVFVDDCIMECRHDLCVQRFPKFLKTRLDPELRQSVLKDDLSLGSRQRRISQEMADKVRAAETHLFWQESVADFLAEMNQAGRAVNRNFFTLPNWGATARPAGAGARVRTGKSSAVWRRASIFQLFEEDHPAGYFGVNDVIGYLLQFNYGLELGIRPAILSYGTTLRHVELGHAEAAAGGGGAYVEPTAAFPEIRRKWRAFFDANRKLLDGYRLVAPVGLVFSFDEPRYGNDKHLREVFAAARTLHKLHIPFATVPLENLKPEGLARHRVIIAAEVRHLSDSQLAALNRFVRIGGRVLATGRCGSHDEFAAERRGSSLDGLRLVTVDQPPPSLSPGTGAAIHFGSLGEIVPKHEFDVVDALDIRTNDAFVTHVRKLGSSAPDSGAYETLRRWLAFLAGGELSLTKDASAVRTVAYERLHDVEGVIIVHAIRYAVPTWGGDDTEVKPAPLELEVPLPAGWTLAEASVLSPDRGPVALEAEVSSSVVCCELPPFEFYSLLRMSLKRTKSPPPAAAPK